LENSFSSGDIYFIEIQESLAKPFGGAPSEQCGRQTPSVNGGASYEHTAEFGGVICQMADLTNSAERREFGKFVASPAT
jgi:hypothetical protein